MEQKQKVFVVKETLFLKRIRAIYAKQDFKFLRSSNLFFLFCFLPVFYKGKPRLKKERNKKRKEREKRKKE